jgi:hypothetical protein
MDARNVSAEIRRKIDAGEPLTKRDLSDLHEIARMSGRMSDKLTYTHAKAYREEQGADKEPTKEEKKAQLVEAVQLSREKAMRTQSRAHMVEYVNAKHALAEHDDGEGEADE